MVHTKRDNYKAKWLASLPSGVQTATDTAHDAQSTANAVNHAQVNTAIELTKARNAMIEATRCARSLAELMDECREVGGTDFGETVHAIDSSIANMNITVMARRMRDVLKIAEFRIGYLTAVVEDQSSAISAMKAEIKSLHLPTVGLQKSTIETLIIGTNPTLGELDDLDDKYSSGEYHRYGLCYEPIDDELIGVQITGSPLSSTPGSVSMVKHSRTDSGVSLPTQPTQVTASKNGRKANRKSSDVDV